MFSLVPMWGEVDNAEVDESKVIVDGVDWFVCDSFSTYLNLNNKLKFIVYIH